VESEGPQNADGSREAPHEGNVVQLGDWIGPRDELVPFGRRLQLPPDDQASGTDVEDRSGAFPAGASPADIPSPDSPPSPDDFWGERAASIHDALQAPLVDHPPAPGDHIRPTPPTPRMARARWARRRGLLATAAGLAALAAAVLALTIDPFAAAGSHNAHASGLPLASVLTSGVARIVRLDTAKIEQSATRKAHAAPTRRAQIDRTPPRRAPISEPVRRTTVASRTPSTRPSTTAYAARVAPATAAPTFSNEAHSAPAPTPPPVSPTRSTSSSAAVTPTGESGALGPIQSPNG
jgi:hypothetical protein